MKLAIKKAKETGVGWVVVNHSNHYGIAGTIHTSHTIAKCKIDMGLGVRLNRQVR